MNVHEYQAKGLLREFGVSVPEGILATTPAEAEAAARDLGTKIVVVKAQVFVRRKLRLSLCVSPIAKVRPSSFLTRQRPVLELGPLDL